MGKIWVRCVSTYAPRIDQLLLYAIVVYFGNVYVIALIPGHADGLRFSKANKRIKPPPEEIGEIINHRRLHVRFRSLVLCIKTNKLPAKRKEALMLLSVRAYQPKCSQNWMIGVKKWSMYWKGCIESKWIATPISSFFSRMCWTHEEGDGSRGNDSCYCRSYHYCYCSAEAITNSHFQNLPSAMDLNLMNSCSRDVEAAVKEPRLMRYWRHRSEIRYYKFLILVILPIVP